MKVLSLFDGISCGRIALERAGFKIDKYYASEVDEYAIKIASKNYPDNINLGDVKELDSEYFDDIYILMGGSPCQNFSFSGTRKGSLTKDNIEVTNLEQYLKLKDNGFEFIGQSYLIWEFVRILKEVKPKYFLLENVVMEKKWEYVISEALGVEPIKINSSLLTAQTRNRLYWTNIKGIEQPLDKGLLLKDILSEKYSDKEILSQKIQDRFTLNENNKSNIGTTKPPFRKIGQRDIVYGENNKIGCLMASDYKQPKQVYYKGILRKLSPLECERLQTLPENYTEGVSNSRRYHAIGNGWTVDVIAHIFKGLQK